MVRVRCAAHLLQIFLRRLSEPAKGVRLVQEAHRKIDEVLAVLRETSAKAELMETQHLARAPMLQPVYICATRWSTYVLAARRLEEMRRPLELFATVNEQHRDLFGALFSLLPPTWK